MLGALFLALGLAAAAAASFRRPRVPGVARVGADAVLRAIHGNADRAARRWAAVDFADDVTEVVVTLTSPA